MKHVFVFDPKAFYNQQWKMDNILDDIGQFFRTQEKSDFLICVSRYRRNAIGIIQNEMEKADPDEIVRIYAIGGEEILYDCINGIVHFPNTQLAAVPYGESCDFLNIFGKENIGFFRNIPLLVESDALPTDVIGWGVNYALNSCYIGMNSIFAKDMKDIKSNLNNDVFVAFSKFLSFLNFFVTLFDKNASARKYTIKIDGVDYSGYYNLIHIANGPYHNGKISGISDVSPDDGLLNIALIKPSYALKTMWSLSRYSRGKHLDNCIYLQAKEIFVQSDIQMWIQIDNEFIKDTGISMSVVHHAVQMVTVNNLSYPSTAH